MQEKVLVLDIDGTLTNSKKEITEATKQGIWNILQHGHKVILASGRPTPGMRKCEEELELKKYGGYLLSFNGARIVECKTGEVVYQRTLPLSIVPGLYEFAKANGCGLITYQGEGVISAFEPDKYVQLEARINGIPIKKVDDFVSYVDFDINKCLMTAPEEIAPELEKQPDARLFPGTVRLCQPPGTGSVLRLRRGMQDRQLCHADPQCTDAVHFFFRVTECRCRRTEAGEEDPVHRYRHRTFGGMLRLCTGVLPGGSAGRHLLRGCGSGAERV